jgi:hypothetical protein
VTFLELVYRLLASALAAVAVGSHPASDAASARFAPGLVASADHLRSARAAESLGADVVRVEFDIRTRPAAMRRTIRALAKREVRPLLLAGFHGRMPTRAEARNLARWAAEFGPGGRFWAERERGVPVLQIEFGNETSYRDQYGDTYSDPSYSARAHLYALRLKQAHAAIARTGREVGLLAQADDGGTASPAWVDGMYAAVPRLHRLVDGWTVHPYGPRDRWEPKLRRLIAQTRANGAPAGIPIDVTEYGISTDNGASLSDNHGWPANQTYAQAASALSATIAGMRRAPGIGRRLRLFMVYAAHDLGRPGSSRDREQYFGALHRSLASKGAYSAAVRRLFRR